MVIRNVLPTDICRNAVREIAAFVGADLADSSTWYSGAPQLDGIVPMHHAQSLWTSASARIFTRCSRSSLAIHDLWWTLIDVFFALRSTRIRLRL